jgi:Holliday junction resolvase RusA-like endonuclease
MTEPVETFTFSCFGTPRAKSRPRHVRGRFVSTANPHEKLWKRGVERAAFAAVIYRGDPLPLFPGPVRVTMTFIFEPPKGERHRIGTPHTLKPDKDNLEKLVLDAMTKARVFKDDSQVAQGPVEKWWGERAGVVVVAEQIGAERAPAPSAAASVAPDWLAANRS